MSKLHHSKSNFHDTLGDFHTYIFTEKMLVEECPFSFSEDQSHITTTAKRIGKYKSWEPIFIGSQSDPLYDERLSWEGRSDKMTHVSSYPWLHAIIYMIPDILLGFPNVLNGLWLFGPRQRFLGPQAGYQNQEK